MFYRRGSTFRASRARTQCYALPYLGGWLAAAVGHGVMGTAVGHGESTMESLRFCTRWFVPVRFSQRSRRHTRRTACRPHGPRNYDTRQCRRKAGATTEGRCTYAAPGAIAVHPVAAALHAVTAENRRWSQTRLAPMCRRMFADYSQRHTAWGCIRRVHLSVEPIDVATKFSSTCRAVTRATHTASVVAPIKLAASEGVTKSTSATPSSSDNGNQ